MCLNNKQERLFIKPLVLVVCESIIILLDLDDE